MYTEVTIIRTCGIDGCQNTVTWIYERGEPTTYWHPGSPDFWIPVSGCVDTKTMSYIGPFDSIASHYSVTHLELLMEDDSMQTIIDRAAIESFDNVGANELMELPY